MTTHTFATGLPGAVACLVLAVGCTSSLGPVPTVEGTIVEVTSDPLRILVEPARGRCGAWFLVDSRTEIRIKTSGDATSPADSDRLRVGVMASAWADGDMIWTCPGKGRAERVIIES
jgi:hypothetical protein